MNSLSMNQSLLVALIGMIIVFSGLAILIILIKLLVRITDGMGKKKTVSPPAMVSKQVPAPVTDVREEVQEENDDAVIAAITAAIICMMGQRNSGFTVRHIRRISGGPAWQRAGREEQVNSRM